MKLKNNLVDNYGYTPFLVFGRYRQMRIANFFTKKSAELSRKANCGGIVFYYPCIFGNSVLTKLIVKNSKKLKIEIYTLSNTNHVVLHLACNYSHALTTKILMEESKAL